VLPTFLGIGAPKCGSTWLYAMLESHQDVLVSQHRKEVHYFDRYFERGPNWYERFFVAPHGTRPAAVGEYTTHYLYDPVVPERVRTVPSIERFLVVLRNPVDRAFSHYRFRRRQDRLDISFEAFVEAEPNALSLGRYGEHLSRWFDHFDRDAFLVLVFEDAVREPDVTRGRLGAHLGVDPEGFRRSGTPANEAFTPRHGRLYATAVRTARSLRKRELDRVITLAKRAGVVDALKQHRVAPSAPADSVPAELRVRLWRRFEDDVARLERLTGIDLDVWRAGVS
jgi:hypothetical protein